MRRASGAIAAVGVGAAALTLATGVALTAVAATISSPCVPWIGTDKYNPGSGE